MQYYVNGLPVGTYATVPGTIGVNARPIEVGNMIDGAYPYDGSIGAMLLYNRAMDQTEIQSMCSGYLPFFSGVSCN